MSEQLPTIATTLYADLTAFTYERDSEFRKRTNHISRIPRSSERHVNTLYSDDDPDFHYDIYDSKKLELVAKYDLTDKEQPKFDTRIIFQLGLVTVNQLVVVPPALYPYVSQEQRDYYAMIEPGDLNETRSLQYTIKHMPLDDTIGIVRTMEYILCDNDTPLYNAAHPTERRSFQRVAVAQEQRTLIVPPRIEEERVDDIASQIEYDITLQAILGTASQPEFTQQERDTDADQTIRGLLKVLRSSIAIPTFDELDTLAAKNNK